MKDLEGSSSALNSTLADPLTQKDLGAALRCLRDDMRQGLRDPQLGPYDYAHYPANHAHRLQRFIDMDLVNIKAILGLGDEWEVLGTCTLFVCCYAPHIHAHNHDTGEEKVFAFIDPS